MTNEEAKKMLKAKLECLKRETSGTDIDCNYRNCDECSLCYEQGNMGEQKEALNMAIKALEQQPKSGEWEKTFESNEAEPFILWECSNCHKTIRGTMKSDYCPNCGADMRGEEE